MIAFLTSRSLRRGRAQKNGNYGALVGMVASHPQYPNIELLGMTLAAAQWPAWVGSPVLYPVAQQCDGFQHNQSAPMYQHFTPE